MPVQLKDAEIRVKLDLSDASKAGGSIEERMKAERKEREREEKREKDKKKRDKKKVRKPGAGMKRVGGALLAGNFKGLITAAGTVQLPIGLQQTLGPIIKAVVARTLASMAIGEMNERFGPYVKGVLDEAFPPELRPALAVLPCRDDIRLAYEGTIP